MTQTQFLASLPEPATALVERAIRMMRSTDSGPQRHARECIVAAAGMLVGAGMADTLSGAVFMIEDGAGILIPHP
jgi:hypothetical protein